jgi:hypothetical protein
VGAGYAESPRKLPGGAEAADVDLIERRKVCQVDDPVGESRAKQRLVDTPDQGGSAVVIADTR